MIILITGASSGFGRAMKSELERRGHRVYGTSRHPAEGSGLLRLDVRRPDDCRAVTEEIMAREGRIDVLINNAGMGLGGPVELTSPEDFRLQMDTNFFGVVNMCRAVMPALRAAGRGRIINLSSIAGRFAVPYQGAYSCSKFAIEAYSEALVMEAGRLGIDVLCVEPGDFATGFTAARLNDAEALLHPDYGRSFARVRSGYETDELHRGGQPEYLARRVARLVEARHTAFHNVITPSPVQSFAVFLSRVMPTRLFLRVIAKFYNV